MPWSFWFIAIAVLGVLAMVVLSWIWPDVGRIGGTASDLVSEQSDTTEHTDEGD